MSKIKPRPKVKHTTEFKTQAVNLFLSQNKPASEVANELGMEAHLLRAWVRQAKVTAVGSSGSKTVLDELAQLKKELKTVRMENEILKKAATFFAKNLS
jgi:transposase-like protein